jgi:hypothetical protein
MAEKPARLFLRYDEAETNFIIWGMTAPTKGRRPSILKTGVTENSSKPFFQASDLELLDIDPDPDL